MTVKKIKLEIEPPTSEPPISHSMYVGNPGGPLPDYMTKPKTGIKKELKDKKV